MVTESLISDPIADALRALDDGELQSQWEAACLSDQVLTDLAGCATDVTFLSHFVRSLEFQPPEEPDEDLIRAAVDFQMGAPSAGIALRQVATLATAVDTCLAELDSAGMERDFGRRLRMASASAWTAVSSRALGELDRLVYRDPLTGVGNRAAWDRDLTSALERQDQIPVVICVLDLDGLKAVNDAEGHEAGDDLIKDMAEVLQEVVSEDARVYRWGGDEFSVLWSGANRETAVNQMTNAENLAPAFSWGVGSVPDDGRSREEVLEAADQAQYVMKKAHKGEA